MKKFFTLFLVIPLIVVLAAGCAKTKQAGGMGKAEPSGFLKDYSMLKEGEKGQATLVYIKKDPAKWKSYDKILIKPVQVWRGEKSDAKDLDKEDAENLGRFLWSKLDEELRKDYQIVKQPGPAVLQIEEAIMEAGKTMPFLDLSPPCIPRLRCYSKVSVWRPERFLCGCGFCRSEVYRQPGRKLAGGCSGPARGRKIYQKKSV